MQIRGLKEVQRNLARLIDELGQAATEGVEDAALDLLGRAVRDAPIDTGDLRGSGSVTFNGRVIARGDPSGSTRVTDKARASDNPTAVVGFDVPYAFKQDQDRELRHPRGGKAGYLSDNFRTQGPKYLRHIQQKVKKRLR